ncbi:hypothetical protein ACEPAI_1444 [Sanghuangporus weigelae]
MVLYAASQDCSSLICTPNRCLTCGETLDSVCAGRSDSAKTTADNYDVKTTGRFSALRRYEDVLVQKEWRRRRKTCARDDGTYDACGGPHEGEENAQQFLNSSIDTDTTLYPVRGFNPGTVANIQDGDGVITIDGLPRSVPNIDISLLPERIRDLIQKRSAASPSSVSQKDWAHLPEWVETALALGENAKVLFGQTRASDASAQASWLVAGVQDLQLKLDIHVETRVDANGDLDVKSSLDAARNYFASVLQNLQRNLDEVWMQSGLDEYGESSV